MLVFQKESFDIPQFEDIFGSDSVSLLKHSCQFYLINIDKIVH